MHERGHNPVADVDVAGVDGDGDGVVHVDELLVRVIGCDGDVEPRVQARRGGDVEGGELEGRDGEGRSLGAVEDVEHGTGDGGQDYKEDDDEGEPQTAGARAAPPATVYLGTVGGAGVAVQLGLGRGKRWVGGPAVGRAVNGWFCRGIDSVRHGRERERRRRKRGRGRLGACSECKEKGF